MRLQGLKAALITFFGVITRISATSKLNEILKLLPVDAAKRDYFGFAVSFNGKRLVVGKPKIYKSEVGSALIYTYNGGMLDSGVTVKPEDGTIKDILGHSVALDKYNNVIIGSHYNEETSHPRLAYIYKLNGTLWVQESKLFADDITDISYSVDIDGNYTVVGTYKAAYVFKYDGKDWITQKKFNESAGKWFGRSVVIHGDYIAVTGTPKDSPSDQCGHVFIYKREGNTWNESVKIGTSDVVNPAKEGYCGRSIDMDANRLVIGVPFVYKQVLTGEAYVYKRNGTSWTLDGKLTPSNGKKSDDFGYSVSIDGDIIVVGARRHHNNGGRGTAYVFKHVDGVWVEVFELLPSDGVNTRYFGHSVAVNNRQVVVGSHGNMDQGEYTGAVYIFNVTTSASPSRVHVYGPVNILFVCVISTFYSFM